VGVVATVVVAAVEVRAVIKTDDVQGGGVIVATINT
jgi:hypothetical protein